MKKRQVLFIAIIAIIALFAVGCANIQKGIPTGWNPAPAASDAKYNYRITGQFAGWTQTYDAKYMMENVSKDDRRLAPLGAALDDALYVYLKEYTPDTEEPAGWSVEFSGMNISLDGNFAVKVIRLIEDATDDSGWFFDMWIPSREAGGVINLSPSTLYTPPARVPEVATAAGDGLGGNDDNPVLLKGAVPYYIVFAVLEGGRRAMGAIVK